MSYHQVNLNHVRWVIINTFRILRKNDRRKQQLGTRTHGELTTWAWSWIPCRAPYRQREWSAPRTQASTGDVESDNISQWGHRRAYWRIPNRRRHSDHDYSPKAASTEKRRWMGSFVSPDSICKGTSRHFLGLISLGREETKVTWRGDKQASSEDPRASAILRQGRCPRVGQGPAWDILSCQENEERGV